MNTKTAFLKGFGVLTVIGLLLGSALVPTAPARATDVLLVSVAITASPGTICAGQSSHITWSSTNATSIWIDQGIGSVLPYGDRYVSPTQTTTYTITGSNGTGGYATASATVYVNGSCGPTPTPPPSPSLRCTPSYQSAASGEYVSFSAQSDYVTAIWPQPQLTWTATGGYPSYGIGTTFGTRFYIGSSDETRTVSVTDGYRTAYCTVYVYGATPTPTPVQQLYLSPLNPTVNSGENVTFTAWGGNGTYSWTASDGTPVNGWGSAFTVRFYNYTGATQYHDVVVTSGGQSARTWVSVRPTVTPTPTPYQTLQCSPSYTTANSGDLVYLNAWGGNGIYSWSAADGSPTYGYGSGFSTRFYNYLSYAQNRTVTVTSSGQSAICVVLVNGSNVYPTPTPYPDARIELRHLGRNVTLGQSGEHTSLRARGGDTLDLIIRVRSTNGSYLSNAYVTDMLPAGLSYIPGTTTVNGYVVGDGITSSGINIGTVQPNSQTVVKFSVRVNGAYVPSWGTVTVNNTAQVRADGVNTMSAQLPITMGQNLNLANISTVKTGPSDSLWLALLISALVTAAYAVYTRTDMFGRRMALAEVTRLSRSSGPNFSK